MASRHETTGVQQRSIGKNGNEFVSGKASMNQVSTEHRIECKRHHWLFSVTCEGIAIKCRASECRAVYVITWQELEAARTQATQGIKITVENFAQVVSRLP